MFSQTPYARTSFRKSSLFPFRLGLSHAHSCGINAALTLCPPLLGHVYAVALIYLLRKSKRQHRSGGEAEVFMAREDTSNVCRGHKYLQELPPSPHSCRQALLRLRFSACRSCIFLCVVAVSLPSMSLRPRCPVVYAVSVTSFYRSHRSSCGCHLVLVVVVAPSLPCILRSISYRHLRRHRAVMLVVAALAFVIG